MTNAYPELPLVPYEPETIPMSAVITYLQGVPYPPEIRRSAYIIFRNESANGSKGFNGNFVGAQADSGRWPATLDHLFAGVVDEAENGTGRERLFLAFHSWSGCLDFLCDRVQARGLYIGGRTHVVLAMDVVNETDLARAYHKEWVSGSASSEPSALERANFSSMYGQALALFRAAPTAPTPSTPPAAPTNDSDTSADDLNAQWQAAHPQS